MYSIADYAVMIADGVRTDAYAQALRHVVTPQSVVLDIGTGPGLFALLACQFGARRVYAIEPDDSIQVARELAAVNGYADRIVFIQDLSTRVTLPEFADVIVSDLRGRIPWFESHIPSIIDARERLLAQGGTMIPQRDRLWAAVVEDPGLYKKISACDDNHYGLQMRPVRNLLVNRVRKGWVSPEQLLVEPRCWAELDYTTVVDVNVRAEIRWAAARAGTAYGFNLWFDTQLNDDIGFSNAPGHTELIYANAFFPWPEPVALEAGDEILLSLKADLVGGDYVWRWDSSILGTGNLKREKANYRQSTFFGAPLSAAHLRRSAADHKPALNEDGQIEHFILSLIDGQSSLGDITHRVLDQFPRRFRRREDALAHVAKLSQRYSQ